MEQARDQATVERANLGGLGAWGHLDSLDAAAARAYAARVDALGYSALWVAETTGRDPFALLALLAGSSGHLLLGTSIASIWSRDAQTTRMAALTLQEATCGRFVLGLGVSHPHLVEKLRGHRYDRPLAHLDDYLAAYRRAVYRGPGAGTLAEPPILVAALRERMLDLAAREADGAFAYLVGPKRLGALRARLDAAAGRRSGPRPILAACLPVALGDDRLSARAAARAYLTPYLRTPAYRASWSLQGFEEADWASGGSDRLVEGMVACGPVAVARQRITELRRAGADHVALIPLQPSGTTESLATLEALAPRPPDGLSKHPGAEPALR